MTYRPIKLIRKSTMSSIFSMAGAINISRQSFASGHLDMMWTSSEILFSPVFSTLARSSVLEVRGCLALNRDESSGRRSHLRPVTSVRVVARRVRRRNMVRRVERGDIVVICSNFL